MRYSELRDRFLHRSRPFVVLDSHESWMSAHEQEPLLLSILSLVENDPCNLQSNIQPSFGGIGNAFTGLLMDNIETDDDDDSGWFLHFQNCHFASVKESRVLWPKPAFLSRTLSPFYSSWILISQNYAENTAAKSLDLQGMIVIAQLLGHLKVHLKPRSSCRDDCEAFEMSVQAGESLVFLADVWSFEYTAAIVDQEMSISFIAEYELND